MDYTNELMLKEFNETILPQIAELDMVNRVGMDGYLSPMMNGFFDDISDYNLNTVDNISKDYQNCWHSANAKDGFVPKMAVLQLREGEKNLYRSFKGLSSLKKTHDIPKAENYEIVFIEGKDDSHFDGRARNLEKIYARFNSGEPHPSNYYGYSLSVGNIVVNQRNLIDYEVYFVDTVGFQKLPDAFLSLGQRDKIRLNMDVRVEHELKNNIHCFADKHHLLNLRNVIKYDEHNKLIGEEYTPIFAFADKRAKQQTKEMAVENENKSSIKKKNKPKCR